MNKNCLRKARYSSYRLHLNWVNLEFAQQIYLGDYLQWRPKAPKTKEPSTTAWSGLNTMTEGGVWALLK